MSTNQGCFASRRRIRINYVEQLDRMPGRAGGTVRYTMFTLAPAFRAGTCPLKARRKG
jgi:hypothetical protein